MNVSRHALLTVSCVVAVGCGPIRGEAIEGRGGSARPAANLRVTILTSPDAFYARCSAYNALEDSIRAKRGRLADSVYRATGTTPGGRDQASQRVTFNVENNAYGDPARDLVARQLALNNRFPIDTAWQGRTDGSGKFSSDWLTRGDYLLVLGGEPTTIRAGLFGAKVQITYEGFDLPLGCGL